VAGVPVGARGELLRRGFGLIDPVRGQVYVHQQCQQRRGGRAGRAHLVQGALEDVAGERGLAPGQKDGRKRACRVHVRVDVDAVEQLLGFLQTALAHAQVGEPDQRAGAQSGALAKPP
jgi:hypothetical protein